jgi:hypothetical protein
MGAEQIAEFLIPFGGQARAVAMAPRAASGAARAVRGLMRAGGEAAEMGTKAAIQSGGDPETIVTAAALGSVAPGIALAVQKVGKGVTEVLPEALYQRVFKLVEDDWQAAARAQARGRAPNPTLAREVLDRGLRGSPKNMAIVSIKKLDGYESDLQAHLRGKTIALPQKQDYIDLLTDLSQQFGGSFSRVGGEARALATRLRMVRGSAVSALDALKLKRLLDSSRSAASFKVTPALSARQDEFKQAADLVRRTLHVDDTTSKLLTEERVYLEALDAITKHAVQSGNRQMIDMIDRLLLTGGALLPVMRPAAIATIGGVKAARSAFVLTNIGQTLRSLEKWAPGAQAATAAQRVGTQVITGAGR